MIRADKQRRHPLDLDDRIGSRKRLHWGKRRWMRRRRGAPHTAADISAAVPDRETYRCGQWIQHSPSRVSWGIVIKQQQHTPPTFGVGEFRVWVWGRGLCLSASTRGNSKCWIVRWRWRAQPPTPIPGHTDRKGQPLGNPHPELKILASDMADHPLHVSREGGGGHEWVGE